MTNKELLLKIIKEQKAKIDQYEHKIAGLEEENESARKLIKKNKLEWLYL